MARHSDVVKKSYRRKNNKRQQKNKIKGRRKKAKLPILNTFLLLGIYLILLKEHWFSLIGW